MAIYPNWAVSEPSLLLPVENIRGRLLPLLPEIMELDRRIVASGKYVSGPYTDRLQTALKEAWQVPGQVLLTKSGIDALILAVWAAELDDGVGAAEEIEVICPNLTSLFPALAISTAGLLRRAYYRVVFVDVDPRTLNVDPGAILAAITDRTRAIMVPHQCGNPADMGRILAIAQAHHLQVIEDCSQAQGARYRGQYVGTFGHTAAVSLSADKRVGGEGDLGCLIVPDEWTYWQAERNRDLGWSKGNLDPSYNLGLCGQPEEKNAGVALLQLPSLERWNARSRQIAAYYRERLLDTPVQLIEETPESLPSYWRCILLLTSQDERDALQRWLSTQHIGNEVLYPHLVSEQGMYQDGGGPYPCRVVDGTLYAYTASRRLLAIPAYPQLDDSQVERVAAAIDAFFAQWQGN